MINLKENLAAILFSIGLIFSGSDSNWMPLPNLAGLALMGGSIALFNVRLRRHKGHTVPSTRLPAAVIAGYVPPQRRVMPRRVAIARRGITTVGG